MLLDAKRLFDLSFSLLGLVFAAPVMLVISILLKLESRYDDVLFRQRRIGVDGEHFYMLKFRKFPSTMDGIGPSVTVAGDNRMSRVGRLLERTKFDELPQLWNILLGQMSFVGPRPETLDHQDLFVGKYLSILDYKPGIFGPSQVAFRNEAFLYPGDEEPDVFYRRELFPRKAELDLSYYSENASFVTDLKWIFWGVLASLTGAVPAELKDSLPENVL